MKRPLRVTDTGLDTARWNTALSAALMKAHAQGGADILRFYRFPRCVLLGASQDAGSAIDIVHCSREAIEIARRVTGGGTVYMAPSMLAWDFVTPFSASLDVISKTIGDAVAEALRRCAVAAVFQAPNSVVVDGRKLSGAATTSAGRSLLHQGTLIIEDATADMARALKIPAEVLLSSMTSLGEASARPTTIAQLQAAIAEALARAFALEVTASNISDAEIDIARQEFDAEIGTERFVLGGDWLLKVGAVA